jgi:hypothetical protein
MQSSDLRSTAGIGPAGDCGASADRQRVLPTHCRLSGMAAFRRCRMVRRVIGRISVRGQHRPLRDSLNVLRDPSKLALHRHLKFRGRIDHDQLFFRHDGAPIRDLGYLAKCWRKSSERLGLRFRRPYCARHTSVSWNLMIGKNPLFVSRQHGHSVTTMWRTYAAWMEGAPETDIALIQAAMNRDALAIERVSNTQIELTLNAPAVAGLGTRLATRRAVPAAQVPDKKGQKEWRRGWDSNTDGTLEIKMLLEKCGLLVPSEPLTSPFVPVDSASSQVQDLPIYY